MAGAAMAGGCGDGASEGGHGDPAPPVAISSAPVEPTGRGSERCPDPRVPPLAERIGQRMVDACTRPELDPMGHDPAFDTALTGHWRGEYASAEGGAPTRFEADLVASDGTVNGSTTEPNTFGPGYLTELYADLVGEVYATRQVVLLKTYKSPGVDHSVLYVGRMDDERKRIEGRWRLPGTHGTFWLAKE